MAIFQIPRGPVVTDRGTAPDTPDSYKNNLLRWRDAAREEAISTLNLNPEYANIHTYIDFLEGKQWNERRPRYRSGFFDNRLSEARFDRLALLTDIRPTIDVRCSVAEYTEQADVARMVVQHEWQRQKMDLSLVSVVDHAMFGTGYWKIGCNMPGSMTVTACGMDCVLPIQEGQDLQDSSAVLYRTYKPLQYFRNIWGDRANGLEKYATSAWVDNSNQYVRPGHIQESTWNSLSPAMRYHLGLRTMRRMPTAQHVFPVVNLEEYWIDDPTINESSSTVLVKDPYLSQDQHNYWYEVAPRQRLFPRKRLVVFAGDEVMYDGPSPYWHGLFPFAKLVLNPIVWGPGGLSKYRDQIPLNKAINEISAATLDVCKKAVNPQVISKEGAVRDAAWQKFFPDMPGGKLKLTSVGQPNQDVVFMNPPILPAYVFLMLQQYLIPTFDRRTGRVDINALARKNQVPGGETIEQMRDSMQTAFRLESRLIERFICDAGTIAVSNVFQFYTMARRMAMLGVDGLTWSDFDYNPKTMVPATSPKEDHWRMFSMQVAPGSLHSANKDRDKQLAVSLFRLSGVSRKEMLRKLDFGNIDQIEGEIAQERGEGMEPDATGKGRVPRLTRSARTGNPF